MSQPKRVNNYPLAPTSLVADATENTYSAARGSSQNSFMKTSGTDEICLSHLVEAVRCLLEGAGLLVHFDGSDRAYEIPRCTHLVS